MRKLGIILALLLVRLPLLGQSACTSNCGFGPDVPTNVVCSASQTDATMGTCSWSTTQSSDSLVTLVDNFNNAEQWIYDANMTTTHTVALTKLAPNATATYHVSSCTHATFGNIGTVCPMTSPDWSSTGPSTRQPNAMRIHTIPTPAGTLSSWWTSALAPIHVFQGQEFFINVLAGVGIGTIGQVSGGVGSLLMDPVSYTTPTSTVVNCGTGGVYGDATGIVPCAGGSADQDFIFTLQSGYGSWSTTTANNIVFTFDANYKGSGNGGYLYNYLPTGFTNFQIYGKAGANLPVGDYTLSFTISPLYYGTGAIITNQQKIVTVKVTVEALTPIPTSLPSSFPTWYYRNPDGTPTSTPFKPQFTSMAAYWGTWNCSNTQGTTSGGKGAWALFNNSGVYESSPFTINTWGEWAWNYDGGRNFLGLGDRLFTSSYADWASGHVYTIGDMITDSVSGVTLILNNVSGAANPAVTGTSGGTRPNFNVTPYVTVTDNGLVWQAIGDYNYWMGCNVAANDGYKNNILLMKGDTISEPDQFSAGILENKFRTGDAAPGDSTGNSFTEQGLPLGGYKVIQTDPTYCHGLSTGAGVTSGGSPYLSGSGNLALCYSATNAKNNTYPNGISLNSSRIRGFTTQAHVAYWMSVNDPAWVTTNHGKFMLRLVETSIAQLDMLENVSGLQIGGVSSDGGSGISPAYQFTQLAEGLLHYYQATVYYSNNVKFPGTTITPDERIPVVLKRLADKEWVDWYDRIYDKNEMTGKWNSNGTYTTANDACYALHPTVCQTARRMHSFSPPYNIWQLADSQSAGEFWTEAASNAEFAWLYAWLWARNSTLTIPTNGRLTATTYRDVAEIMMQHSFDGRYCVGSTAYAVILSSVLDHVGGTTVYNVKSGGSTSLSGKYFQISGFFNSNNNGVFLVTASTLTTLTVANANGAAESDVLGLGSNGSGGYCDSWNVADYANGGRASGAGFVGMVNGAKTIQQAMVNVVSEALPWLDGTYGPNDGVLTQKGNPCWVAGNRNADGSCNTPSPFPDKQAPNPWSFTSNNGSSSVAEPYICVPDNVPSNGNYLYSTSLCMADASKFTNGIGFGTNGVLVSQNTVSGTSATWTWLTVENTASCSVSYGLLATAPSNTVTETHTPELVGGTPVPLWFHKVTVTGLTPSKVYHFGLSCTDAANNTYTMPYVLGNGVYSVSYGASEQALDFATTPSSNVFYLPITAQAVSHGIGLTWTPSTDVSATSQIVCRGATTGSEDCGSPLATFLDNITNAYLDTAVSHSNTYYYTVSACNANGCSASNEASATFP